MNGLNLYRNKDGYEIHVILLNMLYNLHHYSNSTAKLVKKQLTLAQTIPFYLLLIIKRHLFVMWK